VATAREIIKGSLRLIGVIASGDTPTASEETDALDVFNQMLESWSTEGLIIFSKVREEFTLTPLTGAYTIGVTGDFNTSRPLKIESAKIEDQGVTPTAEYPVRILNLQEWADISIKDLQSALPTQLYTDDAYPLATINLWPTPTVANKLVLYSWKPLTTFATANDVISLPPGYLKALRYNLALELAPEYGRQPDTAVVAGALEGKENIKRMNIKPRYLKMDPALLSQRKSFNWLTGE
jgi:hypothetical protein